MLAGKTVLLATHQLQFAPRCDLLLLMEDGRIVEQGTYNDLQRKGFDFSAIVKDAHTEERRSSSSSSSTTTSIPYSTPSPKPTPRSAALPSSQAPTRQSEAD